MKRFMIEFVFAVLLILFFASAQDADFSVNPPIIKAFVKDGSSINYPIDIVNQKQEQRFDIYHSSKADFISVDMSSLVIGEGDVGIFNAVLDGSQGPGVYVGNIVVAGESSSIKLSAILEVESENVLFDVRAKMAPRYFEISAGEPFVVDISVFNVGAGEENVELEYYISDIKGNVILSEKRDSYNKDVLSVRKSFTIPEETEKGDYVFYAYARHGNSLGTNSLLFYVGNHIDLSPELNLDNWFGDYFYFIVGVVLILITGVLIFNYLVNRKLLHAVEWRKRVFDIGRMEFGNVNETVKRLIRQKELLHEAFEKGYIREGSYKEGQRKISHMIEGFKRKLL